MANSAPVTVTSKKDDVILERFFCIYYPFWLKKNKMQAFIDLSSKFNAKTLTYAAKLGLKVCLTDIRAQKINSSTFETFEIELASFRVENNFNKPWFFQKSFLLANINVDVVLEMFFVSFSNANI